MDKKTHLLLLQDSLKRSQREAKGWRRLGFPQEFLELHNADDNKLKEMIEQLEKEIEAENMNNSQ